MVRQSDVKGAYSRVGDPSVKRGSSSSSSAGRLVVLVGFLAVTALFVGLGRHSRTANDDNDRSGQAHHALDPATAAASTTAHHQEDYYTPTDSSSSQYREPEDNNSQQPASHSHDDSSSSSAGGEQGGSDDAGYGEEDAGSRTVNRPGSTAGTSSEDGDGASPEEKEGEDDDDHPRDTPKNEPSSSKEDEEDDDADDRIVGHDSGSKSSHGEPDDHQGSESGSASGEVQVPDGANPYEASSTDPEKEEKHVVEDLKLVEAQEVKVEEAKAQSTLGRLGSSLRIGLGKLFGDKATDQEIEEIAVAVEAEVTTEVNQEIEVASEQILEDEVDKVQDRAQRLRDDGRSDPSIAQGIATEEDADVSDLRHSVEAIESRVEQSIKTRESMAEKKILEDRLSKKLGKKVKLTFVEQEERFDGMDEVMEELPSLRGSPSSHKKKKKKKRGSGGGESTPTAKESIRQQSLDSGDEGDW